MDWIGSDWIGLEWIGLDWIGLDWMKRKVGRCYYNTAKILNVTEVCRVLSLHLSDLQTLTGRIDILVKDEI